MLESKAVRFGIVGCGAASIPVCEAMTASALTELVAVYDVNKDLANDISQRFQAQAIETLPELLMNSTVDAVYIAVPHYLLAPLTRQVLEADKHALTEKPLGISLDEVDQLIKLATEHQLALGVFYEMRYAPAHATARKLIQAGAIGNIIGVQIQTLIDKPLSYWQAGYTGRAVNPWRGIKAQAGGGVLLMNTSHLLDALFYITGLVVTSVSAEIGTLVANVEVEDMAVATLCFNNGAVGSLMAGAHIRGARAEEYCSVYGTEGQICLPDPYGTNPLRIYLNRPYDQFSAKQWHSISIEPVSVYQRAIEEYAKALQSGGCVPIDAQAARRVLAVVLAIYQSAAEKRTITIA
ncbi:MAG TPA: Gfo/Idh/MocA family oxidoreductase [Anaerolineales bacterium]|nr:Gfo/Idh/MocA family oxidoreductase [Anaerolineales bacterium]